MERLLLKVEGMGCQHCVTTIEETLESLKGVQRVEVNLEKGEVLILGDGPLNEEMIRDTIEENGYLLK